MVISQLTYLASFPGQLYFRGSNFFTLLQSNYFDTTVTSSEQLSLQSNCFFEDLRFRKSHFLAAVIFSEYLISRNETATGEPIFENRKFFRADTFWNSHFFGGGITQNKDLYRSAHFLKRVLLHSISFFRRATSSKKLIFQRRNVPHFLHFSGGLPFQSCHFFKIHYLLQQLPFQKNFYFIAMLPLHSYTYYLSVSN